MVRASSMILLHEFGGRINVIDQADALSFIGLDSATGKDELLGARQPTNLASRIVAPKPGMIPETHFGLAENGFVARYDEIAGNGHLGSAAECESIDGRDCWLWHELQKLGDFVSELAKSERLR